MKPVILSCGKVRDSVTHSGGTRGHFWGQSFRIWGHPLPSAPALRCAWSQPGGPAHCAPSCMRGYPSPPKPAHAKKCLTGRFPNVDLQTFSPPYPCTPVHLAASGKKRKNVTCGHEKAANRSVSGRAGGRIHLVGFGVSLQFRGDSGDKPGKPT